MGVQVLVAAVQKESRLLVKKMNISTDAIVVNQCERFEFESFQYRDHDIVTFNMAERGVGLSRNTAFQRVTGEICLFSDDDIVLENGYARMIESAYENLPDADMILFNFHVDPRRKTYENKKTKRVRWYNYGRYPAYCISAKTSILQKENINYSILFGGGAKFSNGEDSLFLRDCLKKRLKIYSVQQYLGREEYRESTWFNGYTEKFFYDRGVLYPYLYGIMAKPFGLRFLIKNQAEMCQEISFRDAWKLMTRGMKEKKTR